MKTFAHCHPLVPLTLLLLLLVALLLSIIIHILVIIRTIIFRRLILSLFELCLRQSNHCLGQRPYQGLEIGRGLRKQLTKHRTVFSSLRRVLSSCIPQRKTLAGGRFGGCQRTWAFLCIFFLQNLRPLRRRNHLLQNFSLSSGS